MANRNKKKINSKQANQISLIISAIYFICIFIKGLVSKPVGDFAVYYWAIGCVTGTIFVYFIFYFLIFKGDDKLREEKEQKFEVAIKQCLCNTDYKQVYFHYESYEDVEDVMNMIIQILKKEGCKFYAKLTENNNIHLVVKDKHNEEVYSAEIENLIYFNSNFKFDE